MTIDLLPIVGWSSGTSMCALYALIGLYFLLPLHATLGGWRSLAVRQQTRLAWLLVLPTAAFVAMWFSGRTIWALGLWLWKGEGYIQYASWYSGIVALATSAILLARTATGRVSRRYLKVSAWGAGLCAGLFGAFIFFEFASRIDGWTARVVAEKKFAFMMKGSSWYPPHLPRRIVDETTPELAARGGKAFALYIDDKREAVVHAWPHYRWWWRSGYFTNAPDIEKRGDIEERFQKFTESLREKSGSEK